MAMSEKKSAWRSPWFLFWIALLVAVVSANVVMIYLSVGANPGLVVEDYYERGQDYENNLIKRRASNPGWQMRIEPPLEVVGVAEPARFRFHLADRDGNWLEPEPDAVTFYAYRPSDSAQDFSVPMQRVGPGEYEAEVNFPLKGVWDILVSVRQGEQEYNAPHRLSAGVINTL